MPRKPLSHLRAGLTMIELLVVVSVIGILMLVLFLSLKTQILKSQDAHRKSDLETIKVAFEDYYNDNNCYPDADVLQECQSATLTPYLKSIPCDPVTQEPYVYVPLAADACKGYSVYASLDNPEDPIIAALNCDDSCGCGYGSEYNYGVSAGTTVRQSTCNPVPSPVPSAVPTPSAVPGGGGASPQPTPTPPPADDTVRYEYACAPGGECNQYNLYESNCEYTFSSAGACQAACAQNEQLYKCN